MTKGTKRGKDRTTRRRSIWRRGITVPSVGSRYIDWAQNDLVFKTSGYCLPTDHRGRVHSMLGGSQGCKLDRAIVGRIDPTKGKKDRTCSSRQQSRRKTHKNTEVPPENQTPRAQTPLPVAGSQGVGEGRPSRHHGQPDIDEWSEGMGNYMDSDQIMGFLEYGLEMVAEFENFGIFETKR